MEILHFIRPYWLIALIIPLVWGWRVWKNERVQSSWAEVCDENLLNYLLIKGENKQRRIPYILAFLIMVLTILAVSGPSWQKYENPTLRIDNPVMIMLNLSSDMQNNDVSPNRLTRAKYVIKDILQTFTATESGFMVYSNEPFVITPLTEDKALIDNLLGQVDFNIMPANGDRLDRAIDMAVGRMQSAGHNKGNLVILTSDVGERFDAALNSAEKAKAQGFGVNIIKISGKDNEKLKMLAQKGGGVYINYNENYSPLSRKINDLYQKELQQSKNMQAVWLDAGYYILWLPALLLLYYFRKGVVFAIMLALLTGKAEAGMFLNINQEAMRDFKQQKYEEAAQKFTDSDWRAAAAYKSGDFEKAYQEYALKNDTISLYNQGNSLAKAGKIEAAIKKYEEALKIKPDFEDAAYNLEYLKKMQQNQQQKQNQKNDNQQQKQDKQQQSAGDEQQNNNQPEQQQQQANQPQDKQQNKQARENSANKQKQNQAQSEQNDEQKSDAGDKNEDKSENAAENENNTDDDDNSAEQNQNRDDNAAENGEKNADNQNENSQNDNSGNNESGENEQNQTNAAQSGDKDDNGQKAEQMQVQSGDNTDDKKQKMRARMQQFRDVPDDAGGLLRALIAKEYSKNRYKDE